MFCLYGLTIQKLQGIIAFWGKKNKIKTKIGFNATYILCNVLESYLYIYYARFRFRREIRNQLRSLERFLETISSI